MAKVTPGYGLGPSSRGNRLQAGCIGGSKTNKVSSSLVKQRRAQGPVRLGAARVACWQTHSPRGACAIGQIGNPSPSGRGRRHSPVGEWWRVRAHRPTTNGRASSGAATIGHPHPSLPLQGGGVRWPRSWHITDARPEPRRAERAPFYPYPHRCRLRAQNVRMAPRRAGGNPGKPRPGRHMRGRQVFSFSARESAIDVQKRARKRYAWRCHTPAGARIEASFGSRC
jgi:hypothetical protein